MDIIEIINYLEENGLSDAEEVQKLDDAVLVKFYYDFDNDEKSAAESYSNDECDYEKESEEWFSEYYNPYLNDIAVDNVENILEDLSEEFEVECKYKNIGSQNGSNESIEFIVAVCDEMCEVDLEDFLNDYAE